MRLPTPRGPLGELVHAALRGQPGTDPLDVEAGHSAEDDALTLWVLHELHYRGFDDVDAAWEWAPATMPLRHRLEQDLELRLRKRYAEAGVHPGPGVDTVTEVNRIIDGHTGPSLARFVQRQATTEQVLALLRQRSIYHLKEADPTAWVVPRLPARVKAPLMEVQFDEYGGGDPARLHHELWRRGMEAAGLDASYGAYIDEVSLPVLEQNNVLSLFGLHRRLRGAALGHLAAFEATSSLPSRKMAQGLRRLEVAEELAAYYDEHVEADAVHEQLAIRSICGALVEDEPDLLDDVLLGVWSCLDLESRTATHLLEQWGVPA